MLLSRRFVLTGSTLLLTAAGLPPTARRAWAVTSLGAGGMQIDSVSDGYLEFTPDFAFAAVPADQRAELLTRLNLPSQGVVESPLNLTLLRQGGRVILFDAGSGPDFMPTAGRLTEALQALGIAPEEVTDIVFTHGHPDHLWGLLDDFDEPLFPAASLHMGRAEFDYWTDPATVQTIRQDQQAFAAGALRRLTPVANSIRTFGDGDEVLPGVTAVATPGHTPGHMSFAVGTAERGVFVTGDFVTNIIGFARPELGASTDHDPAQAAATRRATLRRLADEGWTILGFHLPNGGIGQVRADGTAFLFHQEG